MLVLIGAYIEISLKIAALLLYINGETDKAIFFLVISLYVAMAAITWRQLKIMRKLGLD